MSDVSRLRQAAEEAKSRGEKDELLRLTGGLMALGDDGDPPGLHALRAGVIYIERENWGNGLRLLRRAQQLAIPGTLLHAIVLHNLALALVEMDAPHDVLMVVGEYLGHLERYPAEGQAFHGRMLIHRAAAFEVLDPKAAPDHYDEATNVATGEIRECALIDGTWAALEVGDKESAVSRYSRVQVDQLGPGSYAAYLMVGAFLMSALGQYADATDLLNQAMGRLDATLAATVKRGMLILLGGEISLALGDARAAELAGVEASEIFRQQKRQREYVRAQEFLLRAIRARLQG